MRIVAYPRNPFCPHNAEQEGGGEHMASRSRHLTRNDASGRFSPLTAAQQRAAGERVLAEIAAVNRPQALVHVAMPPVFGIREAAPWLGLLGIGGA